MSSLQFGERPAAGEAAGLLVLHHGRGTSEQDLLPLADVLDPQRRLHVVAPRAPLTIPGAPGFHWYQVPRVGHPDPASFHAACELLGSFHDEQWQRTGIDPARTVLGGFSMGTAMSYALALAPARPEPAAIMGLSGFLPAVAGWPLEPQERRDTRVLITHGTNDPVIDVALGRDAAARLRSAGLSVEYLESAVGHEIDPAQLGAIVAWLAGAIPDEPTA